MLQELTLLHLAIRTTMLTRSLGLRLPATSSFHAILNNQQECHFCNATMTRNPPRNTNTLNPKGQSPSEGNNPYETRLPRTHSELLTYIRDATSRDIMKVPFLLYPRYIKDDMVAYKYAIGRLAKDKAFKTIIQIVESLASTARGPNEQLAIKVMKCYCHAKMDWMVLRTFQKLPLKFGVPPSTKTFNVLLSSMVYCNLPQIAIYYASKAQDFEVWPDIRTCNHYVKALCKMEQYEDAIRYLHVMWNMDIEPQIITYDFILESFFKTVECKVQLRKLIDLLMEACFSGETLLLLRIRILCFSGKPREGLLLRDEIVKRGFWLDPFGLGTLVVRLCRIGILDDAKRILSEEIQRGSRPTDFTFHNVVRNLAVNARFDDAVDVSLQMLRKGWIPDAATLGLILNLLYKCGQIPTPKGRAFVSCIKTHVPAGYMSHRAEMICSICT